MGFVVIFSFAALFSEPIFETWVVLCFLMSVGVFYLLYKSRRIRFDDESVFRIYGKKEKETPFVTILSIKRTSAKINGRRMWKLTFLNEEGKEKSFRFLEGNFQHGSTQELIKKVERVNPSVVIWQHPFFNHPEPKSSAQA